MMKQATVRMRTGGAWLGLVLAALLVFPWLAGCAGPEPGASLDRPFTLAPGQSASITGADLAVRFAEVTGDSRCPQGAECIWAGEVSCRLEITHQGVTDAKVLVEPGSSGPAQTDYAGYRITFDIQPYPKLGNPIDKSDYRLTLTFSNNPG